MKKLLIKTLEQFGYPVILQGTIAEDEPYPESFITFWTDDSEEAAAYENETALTAWSYQVNFYSTDPELVETVAAKIRTAMKAAGFIPRGKGRDLPSDEPTHTGWTQNFYYLENEGVIK